MLRRRLAMALYWAVVGGVLPLAGRADPPADYTLDYPPTQRFCPPIESTFREVGLTYGEVRGRRFRQQRNGGYGLPIVDQVGGRNLRHLGADLGWYQVGEPVYAVAAGIVRLSAGPDPDEPLDRSDQTSLQWGNLVVIEHRLPDETRFVTIYGHLNTNRLVETGDIIEAGQAIGRIGRENPRINGGYKPHLHFGVRRGAMLETGDVIFAIRRGDEAFPAKLASIEATHATLDMPYGPAGDFEVRLGGREVTVEKVDDEYHVPAAALWHTQALNRPIIGYGLSLEGWADPVAFLIAKAAHTAPAPFQRP